MTAPDELNGVRYPEFEDGGHSWISADLGARRHALRSQNLSRWRKDGCPALGGKKLKARQELVQGVGCLAQRDVWFYRDDELAEIASLRRQDNGAVVIDGKRWIANRAAARRCHVDRSTVRRWRTKGCHLLKNRVLDSIKGGPQDCWLLRQDELEEVLAARNASRSRSSTGLYPEFEDGGVRWVCANLAEKRHPLTDGDLSYWRRKGCPALGGRKLAARHELVQGVEGIPKRYVWFHRDDELAEIASLRRQSGVVIDGVRWVSIGTAARRCDVAWNTVRKWQTMGCHLLKNRVLDSIKGGPQDCWLLRQDELEEVLAARNASRSRSSTGLYPEFEDGGVRWVCANLAEKRHPLTDGDLSYWRRKGCPALGGRKLAARHELVQGVEGIPKRYVWFYRETELNLVAASRRGMTGVDGMANDQANPADKDTPKVPSGNDDPQQEPGHSGPAGPQNPTENQTPESTPADAKKELERLRETLPPFDSDEWVPNKTAAFLEDVTTRSLSTYRCAGIQTDDHMLGRDKHGRIWRRFSTPSAHPRYLQSSLVSSRQ